MKPQDNCLLKVNYIDSDNIFSNIEIEFNINGDQWFFEGPPDGFVGDKPYVKLPIKGTLEKMFPGDEVRSIFTAKFDKLDIKSFRMIWLYVVNDLNFEPLLEEINDG
jgi:hypothetical protein